MKHHPTAVTLLASIMPGILGSSGNATILILGDKGNKEANTPMGGVTLKKTVGIGKTSNHVPGIGQSRRPDDNIYHLCSNVMAPAYFNSLARLGLANALKEASSRFRDSVMGVTSGLGDASVFSNAALGVAAA
ncbi:hypothetical protein H6777_03065 [Candidatus Nomurabacteria bacterium]|nr:hypothetical protein [Candidatus Nomurabacteria bacterium]